MSSLFRNKLTRWTLYIFGVMLISMNVVAAFHAYRFTHFSTEVTSKSKQPAEMSFSEKLNALFLGVKMPRPRNTSQPSQPFETVVFTGEQNFEAWMIPVDSAIGTVVLFHGYGGHKSSMLDKAEIFRALGYNTFLVDFMGSGNSDGNQCTIGFFESEQVTETFHYLKEQGEENIVLFGTSMGAVAIMKSINETQIQPSHIILECPFGSMQETVNARFNTMGVPSFPMAHLLVFWGGVENGFWAFGHNPVDYALSFQAPTLLLYGEKDEKVSYSETKEIFDHLAGKKTLKVYPNTGHENYLTKNKTAWTNDIRTFLKE